jgi:AcrR family transcriptional regulator
MSALPDLLPMNQIRRRIHAAAIGLFAKHGVTHVNVSELAAAAGVARGTIYSHVPDIDQLFEDVAAQLIREMTARLMLGFAGLDDPAQRLSLAVRQYIRRAHEEPTWGRFMTRFGLSHAGLQAIWTTEPAANLREGAASGRYKITATQLPAMIAMLTGATLATMLQVLDGHGTWRDIGTDTAELLLVALGIDRAEARMIATTDAPPLPALR